MLKKLYFMFFVLLLSNSALALDNSCKNLLGKWSGKWTVYFSTYHCTYDANVAVTSKSENTVYNFEVKLTNPNHSRILCQRYAYWFMNAICEGQGALTFHDIQSQGVMTGNHITLSSLSGDMLASLNKE